MESLVVYEIPGVTDIISTPGFKFNGSKLQELILNNDLFKESKVGYNTSKESELNENIRKSKTCTVHNLNLLISDKQSSINDVLDNVKLLAPPDYRKSITKLSEYHSISAIKYDEGCFFKRHNDSIKDSYHFATCLILVPSRLSKHTGGTLRVWDENDTLHEFNTDTMENVTLVAFHPRLFHEVLPITSGTRIVFKFDLSYDSDLFALIKAPKYQIGNNEDDKKGNIDTIIDQIYELRTEIKIPVDDFENSLDIELNFGSYDWDCCKCGYENEKHKLTCSQCNSGRVISDLKNILKDEHSKAENLMKELADRQSKLRQLATVLTRECKYKIPDLIKCIKDCKENFVIVRLVNFYPQGSKDFFYQDDKELYQALVKEFPNIGVLNMADHDRGMDTVDVDHFIRNYEKSKYDESNYEIYKDNVKVLDMYEYIHTHEYGYIDDNSPDETNEPLDTIAVSSLFGVSERVSVYNDSTYDTKYNTAYTCLIVTK